MGRNGFSRRQVLGYGAATAALVAASARAQSTAMQIRVETKAGKAYTLDVDSVDTVESVKQKIKNLTGTPTSLQRLVFEGKELEDGVTLAEYNIVMHSTLTLTIIPSDG